MAGDRLILGAYKSPERGRHPLGSEAHDCHRGPCAGGGGREQKNCLVQALKLDLTLAPHEIIYTLSGVLLRGCGLRA